MLRPIFIKRTENNISYDGRAKNDTLTFDVDRCYNSDRVGRGPRPPPSVRCACTERLSAFRNTPTSLGTPLPHPSVESVFDFFLPFLFLRSLVSGPNTVSTFRTRRQTTTARHCAPRSLLPTPPESVWTRRSGGGLVERRFATIDEKTRRFL